VRKDDGTTLELRDRPQGLPQPLTIEEIVAENQRRRAARDEVGSDAVGVGDATRPVLHGIRDIEGSLAAVTEQFGERRMVARRGDDQNFPDTRKHQGRQRIKDHRLVVDGQQLLADDTV
jgi:hypothetical protein